MARKADPHAHAALVLAARAEFAKSGLALARIEDITKQCGLSKGSFYLHYESKDALFAEIIAGLQVAVDTLIEFRHEQYRILGQSKKRHDLKVQELLALDTNEDLKLLELLWNWRDVLQVLTSGCGGTAFESVMVSMLEAEVQRIRSQVERLKNWKLIPKTIDAELMGTMVVGTYFLLIRKLAHSSQKPNFKRWVMGLQELMFQGLYSGGTLVAGKQTRKLKEKS
jgi:AcrR family transcriptional regulator